MGRLNDRIRALEEPGGVYPPHIVQAAVQRLETETLRDYVGMLERVVNEGFPEKEAGPAIHHIIRLCEEVKREHV